MPPYIGLVNIQYPLVALLIYRIAGFFADTYSHIKIITALVYITAVMITIFILAPDWRFLAFGSLLMGPTVKSPVIP